MAETTSPARPRSARPVRFIVWSLHLAAPLAGLWILLARPHLDVEWHHNPGHFWLVLGVALINVAMGLWMGVAARRREDGRLFLVSLAFLSSAGFLAVHALLTPGMLVADAGIGFDLSHPVGLIIASVFAFASSLDLNAERGARAMRAERLLWALLIVLMVAWTVAGLLGTPPLHLPAQARDVEGAMVPIAAASALLYVAAAVRYFLMFRRTASAVLLSLVTAFVLLAEAMVTVILADKWHLSWWHWHVLLVAAFGFIAYSAYVQYRREGATAGVFDAIVLEETARRIRAEYEEAIEEFVALLGEGERTGSAPPRGADFAAFAERFRLSEGQIAVVERAAAALAAERATSRRLAALAEVARRTRVGDQDEDAFVRSVLEVVRPAYGDVNIGLASDGRIRVEDRVYPVGLGEEAGTVRDGRSVRPLVVRGGTAGVLEGPLREEEDSTASLAVLAGQLSISLENVRLYRELGTLFRQYMSPDVAASLLADPDQAALGGRVLEVSALFADLRGFTTFSEAVEPAEIVRMLNRYHSAAVPCVLDNGGTIVQFVGDALLALFNAPARQGDHAHRAVRAALAMRDASERIAEENPDWPRFRIGVNTGPALVGNIGSEELRGFNAMGDAVNVAARLQAMAEPGRVVVGDATLRALGEGVRSRSLGDLAVKGRHGTVLAHEVLSAGAAVETP
ncbi:adenylate/guanylate cyclase domain-containing protein [Nocardiopsis sp. N85]|uniref:adenylate/guanylate cyclase domain-containing protein n=1 Tax=Nocardiopsis sp. N85 TaxID=3029400 RepID=UPI00237F392C|nr:adenylate/guanylate cyclase domain-containing protein [Nocardiopsis sp. N85]MDE3721992.1 adenylate/guanylate cyclase domain-containing protein [Nocardiopsis sp. N85]